MSELKAIRIEVEYEGGYLERATGDDAAQIWKAIEGAFAMQHIHGMGYKGPRMKPVTAPLPKEKE